ncbi:HlyD family secretion protein [Paludisphaera mucosa]|uniref:HlyD family efflux transporter periplasmic adaptor subunit n=1 Tax=Paludisphaera mucosa TaxID=3030827 RepID=A0ABT6F9B8_9BACT|nr:HlyD family efflux transporter periplasmic adaptor subunit [Paludisphaera mucosa]MDG3003970.1 HlyD family efflux transporter periplasmic adaptor subunit [Paludisphaera mucosa]
MRIVLPIVALLGIALAVRSVVPYNLTMESGRPVFKSKVPPPSKPLLPPPERPSRFQASVHGMGLVEAQRENIPIGTPVPGVVMEVYVDGRPSYDPPHKWVGDRIKKGEPLFRIDGRDLEAELTAREATLAAAEAQLHRLEGMPRAEDLPPAQAALEEAEAKLLDAEAAFGRSSQLYQRNMLSASDYDRDRYTKFAAKAAVDRAKADLEKLQAGAWKEDLQVQRAAVLQARSQVDSTRILIERLTVRAPVDSEILQVNVRPGQIATMAWKEPMVVLGEVDRLHVRVDIDENDLPRFREGVPGVATLKGRTDPEFPLKFVRIEPYVIPKKSLTGDNSERVDTRVLQVIYALPDNPPSKVYVGQQMDVFLDLGERSAASGPEPARP